MHRQIPVLEVVRAASTLLCVLVPLDGAYIPINSNVNASYTLAAASEDNST